MIWPPENAMRILAAIFLFALSMLSIAQEAAPDAPHGDSGKQEEPHAGAATEETANARRGELESPFLQSDLELMVGNVQRPNGIVWYDDALYTVCNGDWTVYKIDVRSGETVTFVFGVRNGNNIIAEATESGFDLWVPDPDTGTLWKLDQRREAPVGIATELAAPWGIARLDDERFLLTDTRTNSIMTVPAAGERETVHSQLRAPTGIARHEERIYFANGGSARRGIEYFEYRDDGSFTEVKPLVSGLQNTTNLVMAADGYLYFSYALGTRGVVGRVDPIRCLDEGCGNLDVEMVVFSDIPAPLAITLSDDLRLFLHSRYRPEFYWVQLPTESPQDGN